MMPDIDFLSAKTEILLNPSTCPEIATQFKKWLPTSGDFASHLWFATSGSTAKAGSMKYVALAKEAFLASAGSVNSHLNISIDDIWINPLPRFHVGGLAIHARASLNKAKVISFLGKWQPQSFCDYIAKEKGTFTSLVPTQIYDLVKCQLKAPESLRGVIVGGGKLSTLLYEQARALGWPLFPSYGLTEAASQVATATHASESFPPMKILPHLQVHTDEEGFIHLKGRSLLTCYAYLTKADCKLVDPKKDGWLKSEDRGVVESEAITLLGRSDDFIKISGESVNFKDLEGILEGLKLKLRISFDAALVAIEDDRLGHSVIIAIEGTPSTASEALINSFQTSVLPFERIRSVHYLPKLPRSPLHKLLKDPLLKMISL